MMNLKFERKLTIPMETKKMYPLQPKHALVVKKRAAELVNIFNGIDDRKILIVGPCSADNPDSVLEYVTRLRKLYERVKSRMFIIPRVYTNKPRTTGIGYKGLLHQPDPHSKPNMFKGIIATRQLHMRVLCETGFTCADEMLYPDNYRYIDDLLAYIAVGARSVENQEHRLVSSGLSIPVGMKNPTSGDLSVMMNAIIAAQHSHIFIYRGWEVYSQGNPLAHAILRGYMDSSGHMHPNYHYEDLVQLLQLYAENQHHALIVDCNHANSGKDPFQQPRIVKDVLSSCAHDSEIMKLVKGFMIESYLEDGSQGIEGGCFGKSITDACIGWDKTERLILELAEII